jgi:hypothetical protein
MAQADHLLTCPDGHPLRVTLPTRLEAFGDPDPRASILSGELGRVRCSRCARWFLAEAPLLYTDPLRGHLLLVLPPSRIAGWREEERRIPVLLSKTRPTMGAEVTARLVYGYPQLREKLLLWQAGLDDRLIEVLKLMALHRPELELGVSGRLALELERIDPDRSRLLFSARRVEAPHRPERIYIGLELYREASEATVTNASSYPELFSAPFVSALRYFLPGPPGEVQAGATAPGPG